MVFTYDKKRRVLRDKKKHLNMAPLRAGAIQVQDSVYRELIPNSGRDTPHLMKGRVIINRLLLLSEGIPLISSFLPVFSQLSLLVSLQSF